ncbi:hypothetical protein CYMTET_17887 [Cymbomonas tetramitiformis]|uniref:Uncharacterized protein n=1 Tax=Cymbomonas tetramitiformis TaxID=36881 RepID=A0AAE0G9N2_9CHLO|nr:hypothetical protein CYMTET_17887 [Cymbomonas tetramitiformis]
MPPPSYLVDVLPWLMSLGDMARNLPLEFPIAPTNVDHATELAGQISEFVDKWNVLTGNKPSRDPSVLQAGGVGRNARNAPTPTSTVKKRRLDQNARRREARSRKRLDLGKDAVEVSAPQARVKSTLGPLGATAASAGASAVGCLVPHGSIQHWNNKLKEVFMNKPHLIGGALSNFVRTLPAEEIEAVRLRFLSEEDRVGGTIVSSLRASFAALAGYGSRQNAATRMAGAAMVFGRDVEGVEGAVASILGINVKVVKDGLVGHRNLLLGAALGTAQRLNAGLLAGLVLENLHMANRAISAELTHKIQAFWLSAGISRVSTCKRDVIQLRHIDGSVEKVSKQWLEMTQLEVFRKFKKKFPAEKIELRSFETRKPRQVQRLTRRDTISCCCRYHEDMRLVVEAYARFQEVGHSGCKCTDASCCPRVGGLRARLSARKPFPAFPDFKCGRVEVGRSTSGFTASLLCPRQRSNGEHEDHHDMPCLEGSCKRCGGLQNWSLCPAAVSNTATLDWHTYENVHIGVDEDGKNKHRVQFVQKTTTAGELLAKLQALLLGHAPGESPNCVCSGTFVRKAADGSWRLEKLVGVPAAQPCRFLKPYAYHCFMATHSMTMFNKCKAGLPLGHCLILFDFSENHALNIPRAIQSLHWIVKQATLLCCVLWRHAVGSVDGQTSTEANPIIVKDLIYLISDTLPHSHRGIQHMRKLIVSEYFVKRGIPLPKFMHEWADGSAAQNKCATAFADVVESGREESAEWPRGLGIPTQRNFFETSHARGEQDAMGVAVKHEASLAVMSTTDKWHCKILDAKSLYEFCMERLQKPKDSARDRGVQFGQRFFFLVDGKDVDISGPGFDTVDRTLALHSVRAGVGLLVGLKRDRQCYCDYCYAQCAKAQPDTEGCLYRSHVDSWEQFTLTEATESDARRTRTRVAEARDDVSVKVARGNTFARLSGGDPNHPYYLVKAWSEVKQVINADGMRDDYYSPGGEGVNATPGEFVVEGRFYEWADEESCEEYYIDTSKKCLTYSHHVVCVEVTMTRRKYRGKEFYRLTDAEHQRILGLL